MQLIRQIQYILFIGFCISTITGYSKEINPEFNQIFLQGEVSIIEIDMDENDKQQLLHPVDLYSDTYYHADFHFINSLIDTTMENVGIRLRGKTARGSVKKPLKIDFKEYGGEQFFKLKKLNLKPNTNDPSQLREYLTTLMYRKMEVPVARSSYTEVYINDEYMGIYLNVENIDDEFVDRRFGNEGGNLYKCAYGTTLETTNDIYDNSLIELKTNEEINDRSELGNLIQLLNTDEDGDWDDEIQSVFEVDIYLRQLAVEAMVGHWDGYSYNINNYYLYENPETGKIIYIPYDMDNTWGIDWVGKDWGKRDLLNWSSGINKTPLTTRILDIPEFNDLYIKYLYDVLGYFKNQEYFDSIVYLYFDLLSSSIDNDTYYLMSFNFEHSDFYDSYEIAAGGHVKYSIGGYIETRIEYAEEQLPDIVDTGFINDKNFSIYPNPSNGKFIYMSRNYTDSFKIEIFDIQGRSVCFNINENNIIMFEQKLSPGIYVLKAGTNIRKFLVVNNENFFNR